MICIAEIEEKVGYFYKEFFFKEGSISSIKSTRRKRIGVCIQTKIQKAEFWCDIRRYTMSMELTWLNRKYVSIILFRAKDPKL